MTDTWGPGLVGRATERNTLDGLLGKVRTGESEALVIRGEAGIGKTALLRYAARQASGFRVTPITGVEAEVELAFALSFDGDVDAPLAGQRGPDLVVQAQGQAQGVEAGAQVRRRGRHTDVNGAHSPDLSPAAFSGDGPVFRTAKHPCGKASRTATLLYGKASVWQVERGPRHAPRTQYEPRRF